MKLKKIPTKGAKSMVDRKDPEVDPRTKQQSGAAFDHRDPARDEVSTPDKSAPMGYLKNDEDDRLSDSEQAEVGSGDGIGNDVETSLDNDPDKNDKNK
jgi:hypothetical protein